MTDKKIAKVVAIDVQKECQEYLLGHSIDAPRSGAYIECSQLVISGWVVGKSKVVAIQAVSQEGESVSAEVGLARPDVLKVHPNWLGAEESGFRVALSISPTTAMSTVVLSAELESGQTFSFVTICLQLALPVESSYSPRYQPVILSALGRSGTTWFLRLLSSHPQIITHQKYPYETRISHYWMQVYRTFRESLNLRNCDPRASLGGPSISIEKLNPFNYIGMQSPQIVQWFYSSHWAQVQEFCQKSIDLMYDSLRMDSHEGSGQDESLYFLEKNHPNRDILFEVYPDGKEIVLVRDFRDIVCSVLAFNHKRGFQDFGRQNVADDGTYIQTVMKAQVDNILQRWKEREDVACLVRYEDLISQPAPTLEKISQYLGIQCSNSLIEQMMTQASQSDNAMSDHRTSEDPQSSIGRWRTDLSHELIALCNEAFSEALDEFRYER